MFIVISLRTMVAGMSRIVSQIQCIQLIVSLFNIGHRNVVQCCQSNNYFIGTLGWLE